MCESELVPVLKAMTEDEDADVRYFSGEALGSLVEMKGWFHHMRSVHHLEPPMPA